MDPIKLPNEVYASNPVLTADELQSHPTIALDQLPPESKIFPGGDKTSYWTVKNDGSMVSDNAGLQASGITNVSDSHQLPEGATAVVPVTISAKFVKKDRVWKSLPRTGANVQLTGGQFNGPPGLGNFSEVQSGTYGGGEIQAPLPDVRLEIPLSLAEDGIFGGSDVAAFTQPGNGIRKLSIVVAVVVVGTGDTVMYKTVQQYTVASNGISIIKGKLAMHAAAAVTTLLIREKSKGTPLCVNNVEIDPKDLLLVKLKQVSQGSLQAEVAYRNV